MLPQDLLYVLNRYSEIVGDTVRMGGGVPILFLGDAVTALFGHATRTLAAAGNTIDVAWQLAAAPDQGELARIVVSEAVMLAAGHDTRAADWREIVLPNGAPLKVTSIDNATAPMETKAGTAR